MYAIAYVCMYYRITLALATQLKIHGAVQVFIASWYKRIINDTCVVKQNRKMAITMHDYCT